MYLAEAHLPFSGGGVPLAALLNPSSRGATAVFAPRALGGHRCFLRSLLRGDNERLCGRDWGRYRGCSVISGCERPGLIERTAGGRCLHSALGCVHADDLLLLRSQDTSLPKTSWRLEILVWVFKRERVREEDRKRQDYKWYGKIWIWLSYLYDGPVHR